MSEMFQWQNGPLEIVLDDDEGRPYPGILEDVAECVVSFDQPGVHHVDKTGDDLSIDAGMSTITVNLTQEDTAGFACPHQRHEVRVWVQVNILYQSGERQPTYEGEMKFLNNIYRQEMR